MAQVDFPTTDANTVKRWSKDLEREALPSTVASLLVGRNKGTSALTFRSELVKNPGDRLRIPYLFLSNQAPIQGAPIENNEHAPDYDSYDLLVDKQSHAERREVDLSDQRTHFAFRDDMKYLLANRWAETMEISILNQLGGNSLGTDHSGVTGFDGNNTIAEPSTNYHLFSGAGTSEATLASGDNLSSDDIRAAATQAETFRTDGTGRPIIRRTSLPDAKSPVWGLIMAPRQRDHLYAETATAGSFYDIVRANIEGGQSAEGESVFASRYKNTMYQKIGVYAGVCLYVDPYTPFGTTDGTGVVQTDVDRSIFFGAQAGSIGFGKTSPDMERFSWREEMFRYKESYGIAAVSIWGVVKAQVDGADLGTIVISSHAS